MKIARSRFKALAVAGTRVRLEAVTAVLLFAASQFLAGPPASPGGPDGWPAIPKDELELNPDPAWAGSAAIVLYREVHTDDIEKHESHLERLKILSDEGKDYGDVEIPYNEREVQVEDIRARIVHPDGTAIEFQGQVFDKLVAKARGTNLQAKAFTLPDVRPGNIIEYSYRMSWKHGLPDVVKHPEHYAISKESTFPTAHWDISGDLFVRRARYSIRPVSIGVQWWWRRLPPGVEPVRQQDGTIQLDIKNLPAFREEPFMPPENALKAQVDFYYVVGRSSSTYQSFWGDEASRRAESYAAWIGDAHRLQTIVASLVQPGDSAEVKLRKLYARVQRIRNLGYERTRTQGEEKKENLQENRKVEDVWTRNYGRGNEINLLFVALVRAVGLEAWVVTVASRERDFFSSELLDASQLNSMVVSVQIPGKGMIFLDPATRPCPFGLIPWEETASQGLRIGPLGGPLIDTPRPLSADAIVEKKASLQLGADGTLEGTVQVFFRGQNALDWRRAEWNEDQAGRKRAMENWLKDLVAAGATAELVKATGWESIEEPLSAEFKLTLPGAAQAIGPRLVMRLALFQESARQSLPHTQRLYPVYFRYPHQELDALTISLPPGFEVEGLPSARKSSQPGGSYEIAFVRQPNAVLVDRRYVMDEYLIPAESYGRLRTFFRSVQAGDHELGVFQKTK